MLKETYKLPTLPPKVELETKAVLKAAAKAHRHLAELKGKAATIPNQSILIDTLSLQEAKASSEIENIVTTQDELFQASLFPERVLSAAAKEVSLYRDALKCGIDAQRKSKGLITNNSIIEMFQILKRNDGGFRKTPGTALKNESNGEIVYVPPQKPDMIIRLMTELERFINDNGNEELDPLIRMAIIHHQFESIHPFPDGNGRIGRILNVLYLGRMDLLDIPVLYLSRAITQTKSEYYRLLQHVRDTNDWEPWLIYILEAVQQTSIETLNTIEGIKILMSEYKGKIRNEHKKIYSQDLLNNLFRHPYTRIEFVQQDLNITRQTASKYLEQLADNGLLTRHQEGNSKYFINSPLVELLMRVSK